MHPRDARNRRLTALHNAELAGRACAQAGGTPQDNPYLGKRIRGATVALYESWARGFHQQRREQGT